MKNNVKKIWEDPVWSKVIAASIIACATGVVSNWSSVFNFLSTFAAPWAIYVVCLGLGAFCLFYLCKWFFFTKARERNDTIYVREDMLSMLSGSHSLLNFTCFQFDKNMPLCELIEKTKENFIEYALHEMEYGKDWVFISWPDRAKIDENKKYKTLGQLGIKPEHVLEVFPYFTKEKMKSFPTHPSLTVHPNHYREDW